MFPEFLWPWQWADMCLRTELRYVEFGVCGSIYIVGNDHSFFVLPHHCTTLFAVLDCHRRRENFPHITTNRRPGFRE